MSRLVVGLDLSLSASGVTRIREGEDRPVMGRAVVPGLPMHAPVLDEIERMHRMAQGVYAKALEDLRIGDDILFMVEGPIPFMNKGKGDERAGLRWMVLYAIRGLGHIVIVPPKNAKKYWTGNGSADKKMMATFAKHRYPGLGLLDDNAVDALALAHMGAEHLGINLTPRPPAVDRTQLLGLAWPNPKGTA